MNIVGPRHSTAAFDYDASGGQFITEASSLDSHPIADRLYDDACDLGFVLVSHVTGKELPFYWSHDIKDAEGELVADVYKSTKLIHGRTLEVHILND